LPERFGAWKTVYNRFARWAKRGKWERIFKALAIEVDETGSLLDATIVRAHQDAAGGKGGVDAIISAVLEEAFRPRSTRSRRRKAGRSTSR
jgi:transposase